MLTYLARGLHADVALLSLTRGEGGQNDLGPEQAPQLGLIRTQELLAATRGYGVKLYFTRARDFGFSKTPEETEKVWGDQVLEDMVRVIRTFRPNVVISNFGNVHSGHGHHQASGLLTPKALQAAADANAYPQLLNDGLQPWSNGTAGVPILDVDRGSECPKGYAVPISDISPLYGKSYRQIGLDAFANHRTQGISAFLGSPFLRRPVGLVAGSGIAVFDPAMLNISLIALAGEDFGLGCGGKESYCDLLKKADQDLAMPRGRAGVELESKHRCWWLGGERCRIHRRSGRWGPRFVCRSTLICERTHRSRTRACRGFRTDGGCRSCLRRRGRSVQGACRPAMPAGRRVRVRMSRR